MRIYINQKTEELKEVRCNCCKKIIPVKNGVVLEGVFSVRKEWSYFSQKDGMVDNFDLCEACYDEWIKSFEIPVQSVKKTELV